MNTTNDKKLYIYKLADFLSQNEKIMSGEELADHLNRNNFLTTYGTEYEGGRGIYKLISETFYWLKDDLELPKEASKVSKAYPTSNGEYAF